METREKTKTPVREIVLVIVLVLAAALSCLAAITLRGEYSALRREKESRMEEALAAMESAERDYALADPAGEAANDRWTALTDQELGRAEEELNALSAETREFSEKISAAQQKLDELAADEDYAYYRDICREYEEGRAYVEELLADH